jgi:signal transduction histidine kinase
MTDPDRTASLTIDVDDVHPPRPGDEDCIALMQKQIHRLQKLAGLGTMSAILAHEFNNLLTPIIGYVQAAQQRDDPRFTATALEKTLAHARHAAGLCAKVLGMASDDTSAPIPTDLRPLVEDALECLGRDPLRDGIVVSIEVSPTLQARINPAAVRQVLFNLLLNARQAMLDRRGTLAITAQRAGDRLVRLSVRDSGPGIAPDLLPRIFEPFVTTKSRADRPDRAGLGLGLYVSRQLVEECGGKLTVESRPGHGATFTLWLPAAG